MTVPGRNDAGGFGRITTSGVVTLFAPDLVCCAGQRAITVGPDGNLWFTGNHLGRITMDGEVTEFPVGAPGSAATAITPGPDGNLWFTKRPNLVARATTDGVVTDCHDLGPNSDALSIASGPDGNLWIAEPAANRISREATACASPVTVQPTLTG
jgi:virginiamycin B lyase